MTDLPKYAWDRNMLAFESFRALLNMGHVKPEQMAELKVATTRLMRTIIEYQNQQIKVKP